MKSFRELLEAEGEEEIGEVDAPVEDTTAEDDAELITTIRDLVRAEYDAVEQYERILSELTNELAIKVLTSVIEEEKVHAGEFLQLLTMISPAESALYARGAAEVSGM